MSILKFCSIKFYTKGAGKSAETPITITVRDENEAVAAFTCKDFGPFEEHSDNGPFDLAIINASEKGDLRRGSIAIRMDPTTQGIWRFNFFTFLTFSDGTNLAGREVGIELKHDRNEQIFGFDTIIT
jgi:hypothetical protein